MYYTLMCLERPRGLIKGMRKQCVPGSFSGYEAGGGVQNGLPVYQGEANSHVKPYSN
jgi:hypothetical protein